MAGYNSFGPAVSDGIPIRAGQRLQLQVSHGDGGSRTLNRVRFGIHQLEPRADGSLPGLDPEPPATWDLPEPFLAGTGAQAAAQRTHAATAIGTTIWLDAGTGGLGSWDGTQPGWTAAASLPDGSRAIAAVEAYDGKVWLHGGLSGGINTEQGTMYAYDGTSWSTRASDAARRNHGMVAVGSDLYLIGGWLASAQLSSVVRYTPATDTYATMPSLPAIRFGSPCVVWAGRIWVFGGLAVNNPALIQSTVYSWAPGDPSWTTETPLSQPVLNAGSGVKDGVVTLFGGYGAASRLMTYDLSSGQSEVGVGEEPFGENVWSATVGGSVHGGDTAPPQGVGGHWRHPLL